MNFHRNEMNVENTAFKRISYFGIMSKISLGEVVQHVIKDGMSLTSLAPINKIVILMKNNMEGT